MRFRTSSPKLVSFPPKTPDTLMVQSFNTSHWIEKNNLNKVNLFFCINLYCFLTASVEPALHGVLVEGGMLPSRTILLTPYSMMWDWRVQEQGQCFFIGLSCIFLLYLLIFFPLSSFCLYVGIVGQGSSDWQGGHHSLPALHCRLLLIIILK